MPYITSFGMSPVSAMLLYILAICSFILSGAYFISSTGISSQPGLLFGFILAIAFRISLAVNGVAIRVGGMIVVGCLFSCSVSLKYSAIILLCSSGFGGQIVFSFH